METTKLNLFFFTLPKYGGQAFALLLFTFSLSLAQEKPEAKVDKKTEVNKPNSTQAIGDSVSIKSGSKLLMSVTEETTAGAIKLLDAGTVSNTSNKLYNNGNSLYWNGSALGTTGGVTKIDDLADAKTDGTSLFLGNGAGVNNNNGFGVNNTAVGNNALNLNTTGDHNTANGFGALESNTSGFFNTANGSYALYSNTTGNYNTANGNGALAGNTYGGTNTANGTNALNHNTTGDDNTANGTSALFANTSGNNNTANGGFALYLNKVGSNGVAIGYASQRYANSTTTTHNNYNTSVGYQSLRGSTNAANNTGNNNTAVGYETLLNNTTGSDNVASGSFVLHANTTGNYNTGVGYETLLNNTAGHNNVANGYFALRANTTGDYNTGIGRDALIKNVTGDYNTSIGYLSGPASGQPNLTNTTCLGNGSYVTASNTVRIGNNNVTQIGGAVAWSNLSDGRYKNNIKNDVKGLNFILNLKPISYNLTVGIVEERQKRHTGFIAQEVEELAKKIGYDFSGIEIPETKEDTYALRYAEFVVPIVKAMQEQQEIILTQDERIKELEKHNAEYRSQNVELEDRLSKIESLLDGTKFTSK